MSIPVEIEQLAEALADRGAGYLLTASADGRAKAVTVEPTLSDGVLHCPPSRGSARNLDAQPAATLLFPPTEPRGHTLLVDGTATADDGGRRRGWQPGCRARGGPTQPYRPTPRSS